MYFTSSVKIECILESLMLIARKAFDYQEGSTLESSKKSFWG